MPVIKPRTNRVRSFRHICRLQEPNRDALVLYARFIGDTADHVLNQLIETVLVKDREFAAWRAEHPEEVVLPSARRLGSEPPRVPAEAAFSAGDRRP
jgi:hypothetical protein